MPKQTPHDRSARKAPSGRTPSATKTRLIESRIVLALILATLFLANLPALLGYFITPDGVRFIGAAYNIDDYCNYLSWVRQCMDGHFFLRSLFTTEPQKALEFNIFFWLLGRLAHATHLSPQVVLLAARVLGGAGLLALIYRFYRFCLPHDPPARLTAFGFACLSSGFGWLTWNFWRDKNFPGAPVDAWQPEAYTFLTLNTSALMTVSTLLIVGALYALALGERTGKWRYSVIAGVCGAILGNMHSYDVLHLSGAWGLYLVVTTLLKRGRHVAQSWWRALVALGLTLPTTIYEYLVFRNEAVFRDRANVRTLSPEIWHYALGYGLVFLFALCAAWLIIRRTARLARGAEVPPDLTAQVGEPASAITPTLGIAPLLFPLVWAVAGLLVIYLPVAFQRKMIMGEHIPLCLLAGVGAAWCATQFSARRRPIILALCVLASIPSNLLFLSRDMAHLVSNRSETLQTPYISDTLVDSFQWIAAHTPPNAAVVGSPQLCCYLPGYADRAVWAGHWAETPDYADKVGEYARMMDAETPSATRRAFLQSTGAEYLLYQNDVSQGYVSKESVPHSFADLVHQTPPYLKPVYANKDFTLFQIAAQ